MPRKQLFHTFVLLTKPIPRHTALTDRIVDAACTRFADHGYDGINLRELTKIARVNLAAISYYFGGKERLFLEVVRRRIHPLCEKQRIALAETAGPGNAAAVPLEQTVALFLRPILEACRDAAHGGPAAGRLYSRLLAEAAPTASPDSAADLQLVLIRFSQAIRRHVPHLPPEEFLWRFTFAIGALQHGLANLHHLSERTRGICRNNDYDGFGVRYAEFAVGVFAVPARVPGKASKIT